jgi:hypothetical protein
MANALNISSEEQLLQLLNEGKITEEEYEQLRQTLQKSLELESESTNTSESRPARTSGLAIASLVFSLIGPLGCIPAIICGHIALRKIEKGSALRGRGLALAGLIIGYIVLCLFTIPLMLWVSLESTDVPIEAILLKHYPLDSTEAVLTQSAVTLDRQISSDGNGSLRIDATEPTTVRLFETGDIDIEDARLIYQARLRTENLQGKAYLEMWCHFPGLGDAFSRGLASPLTGTTDWTTEETPFFLKKGENPDNVKLNLVVEGKGMVWIDDIRLLKGPLKY